MLKFFQKEKVKSTSLNRCPHPYSNLQEHLLQHYHEIISFSSPTISEEIVKHLKATMRYPLEAIENEELVLEKFNLDKKLFRTTWGNDPQFYKPFNAKLCKADPEAIDRLRLIYFYSGWPIAPYHHRKTFPIIDPTFMRYLKGLTHTPKNLQFQAPNSCGEAGWRVNGGIVNHDVAIVQERLQFLHFTGAIQHLNSKDRPVCLEIGAGIGMFALALSQSCQSIDYFIVDVPSVLAQSFAYLSVNKPEWSHDFVTPDNIVSTTHQNASHRITYVPFYLLPKVLGEIQPNLALNFMSLHEMTDAQISYYSKNIAEMLRLRNGIFMEFNSYRGHNNPRTYSELGKYFQHFRRFEFPSLAMVPTLWTNHIDAIEKASEYFEKSEKKIDFEEMFSFDAEMEYPHVKNSDVQKLLDKDLGSFINCSITKWMALYKLEHANHLSFYRHTSEQKNYSPGEIGDERFWHQIKS
jgi:hypothetical protein